jgi:GNAT superfamily N-acetyltransferase
MTTTIRKIGVADVDAVAPLFDAYRQFYGRPSDPVLARQFLTDRLSAHESIVLLAQSAEAVSTGYVQIYPTFSSVRAARIYILNDLFVSPQARGKGVGRLLMEASVRRARDDGAARLKLSTAINNFPAQRLYESLGWIRDQDYYEYNLGVVQ